MNINDYYHLYLGQPFKVEKVVVPDNIRYLFPKDDSIVTFTASDILFIQGGSLFGKLILTPVTHMPKEVLEYMEEVMPKSFDSESTVYASGEVIRFQLSKGVDLFGLVQAGLALNSIDL
jgi:hypothetical protein